MRSHSTVIAMIRGCKCRCPERNVPWFVLLEDADVPMTAVDEPEPTDAPPLDEVVVEPLAVDVAEDEATPPGLNLDLQVETVDEQAPEPPPPPAPSMRTSPSHRKVALWPVVRRKERVSPPHAFPATNECLSFGFEPEAWPAEPLLDVLERRHGQDTWFQAVTFPGENEWPRLRKVYLQEEADRGAGLAYLVLDLDRPDHHTAPWPDADTAREAVRATVDRLGCSVYATRGGLRAVWALAEPVPLRFAQSFINAFHAWLPDGLPVENDKSVKDWTRGFRVPWCPRADGKVPAWGTAAPPMDLSPLRDGAVLEGFAPGLTIETAVKVRQVIWPALTTAPMTSDEQRIAGIARSWVQKLESAPSRHGVLLRAGRHIGGLCARYGVSPERWAVALVEATDSSNAFDTVRSAFDYGAHEPCEFPPDSLEFLSRGRR